LLMYVQVEMKKAGLAQLWRRSVEPDERRI
jgi:hypothetical protein